MALVRRKGETLVVPPITETHLQRHTRRQRVRSALRLECDGAFVIGLEDGWPRQVVGLEAGRNATSHLVMLGGAAELRWGQAHKLVHVVRVVL